MSTDLVATAVAFLRSGQFAQAEAACRKALAQSPGNVPALFVLADILGNQFRLPEAADTYRRAIALSRPHPQAHHNLGAVLAQMERAEEALEELNRAEQLGFQRAILYINRGRALTQLYRLDDAERAFQRALELEPRNVNAHLMLAQLRFMRGDADCARDVIAAASTNPADASLQLLMADVLRRTGNLAGAEQVLRNALTQPNATPYVHAVLASVLQDTDRLDEALLEAEAAVASAPEDSTIVATLVSIQLSLGRHESASRHIRVQRERQPHDQLWLAHEASAARLSGDPGYRELYDYDHFVQTFDVGAPLTEALVTALTARHAFANHPLDQSLRNGSQTARSLLTDPDPAIRTLLDAFVEPLERYRQSLGTDSRHPLLARNTGQAALTGCWSVQLRRGGCHHNHVHPQGWISSAYYVSVPAETADFTEKSGWLKFGEPRHAVPGATPERFIQPLSGRLVLFPSYFWHGTNPLRYAETRTTVAFDALPRTAPG